MTDIETLQRLGAEPTGRNVVRPMTNREFATLLAALRYWQRDILDAASQDAPEVSIATDMGSFEPLDFEEIETLCDGLNSGEIV